MFNSSLPESAATVITLGYITIPDILLIAFVFGRYNAEHTRRTIKPLCLSTSWILVVCAWIIWATSTTLRMPALLIALGLTFGATGDLVLADVLPLPKRMISSILVFSIGHLCYIAGFTHTASVLGLNDPFTGSLLWVAFVGENRSTLAAPCQLMTVVVMPRRVSLPRKSASRARCWPSPDRIVRRISRAVPLRRHRLLRVARPGLRLQRIRPVPGR